ncbi:peptidase domain-containing ABC transporter [Sodaliphilus pleomorphus]|uniref:Peptidase domain-containing ABC transporter n=1 Tax=Sodaliphilus pleomorphus TaxID=2606626 RepID=A0A6L5XAH5_9BACT|nr:peptidase domain-containing ABC transporter [Sodaliphilus pleomorphus]MSS17380.1 peptidase domain-containing ABC transporter [Sodaliphilus pleomorphus]
MKLRDRKSTRHFKVFWQVESTDCGPACLQMICNYWGRTYSQQCIKQGISISRIGVTLGDIKRRSEELGFNTAVVKATADQLQKIPFPVILHWRGNHFVVLYCVRLKKNKQAEFMIADPSIGKIKFQEKEFIQSWQNGESEGFAILLKPSERFFTTKIEEEKTDWSIAKTILKQYVSQKLKVILALSLLILSMFSGWMIPYIYQLVIDKGVIGRNIDVTWQLFMVQLSFFVGYVFSNTLSSLVMSKVNFLVGITYIESLLRKLMHLPMKYFDTKLNTEFMQRLDDFNSVRSFFTDNLINLGFSLINALVYLTFLAYYSLVATVTFLIVSIIGIIWNVYFLHERKFIDYSLFVEQARNRNLLYEILNGMPDIKVNNAQYKQTEVWKNNQQLINSLMIRQLGLNFKQSGGVQLINKLRDIAILCLCGILTIRGELTLGVMMSVSYILGQLVTPVSQFQSLANSIQQVKISVNRLSEVQRKKEENSDGELVNNQLRYNIIIDSITFKYEGSFCPYVFNNLSISLPENKVTAIVGNSGSGKSTLIKLILGFYEPQKGEILVNGAPLNTLNIDIWRSVCGVVLQDGRIFSGTVAENIALGDSCINMDKVKSSAKLSCINDFIEKQPGQYDMKIGPSGIELSQGQKQRILIARAVYKDPKLLIFDEATSSLDTVNERRIMDNLEDFFKNRTVIVVAHRLSTVVNADNIVFLENGMIAEQGTHQQLVDRKGKYYELIKNQLELES